jgi:hypothetical protein
MVVLVYLHSLTGRKSAAELKKNITTTKQQFTLVDRTAILDIFPRFFPATTSEIITRSYDTLFNRTDISPKLSR